MPLPMVFVFNVGVFSDVNSRDKDRTQIIHHHYRRLVVHKVDSEKVLIFLGIYYFRFFILVYSAPLFNINLNYFSAPFLILTFSL